jgi:dipeptidyl aminopeptidase/acylaminoacyl peptidase
MRLDQMISRKGAKVAKTQRRGVMIKFRELRSKLCVFATFAPLRELLILTITLACIFDSTSLGQTRKPMVPSDILRIAAVSDAQISPNGQWIIYTVSSTEGDRSRSTLWLARVGLETLEAPTSVAPQTRQPDHDWREIDRPPSLLLPSSWTASTPRWSPDSSRIAFVSNHDDQNGIWVVNVAKPEPRFVAAVQSTNFFIPYAGESLAWSPDSKRIAYISASEQPSEGTASAGKPEDPRVIDRIQYKSRTSFSDNRRTHVWIVEVDKPEPRQLTSGAFYDHAITFDPRGDEIAFLSNHESDPDANNNSDIFAVDFSGQVRQLTQTKGCEYEPSWSPDGRWIAYTATKREVTTIDSVAEDAHVWVIAAAGGAGRELTAQQDRRARGPRWSPDSRAILFLAGDRGKTTLFRVGLDARRVDRLSIFYFDGQFGVTLDDKDSKSRPATESALSGPPYFQIGNFSVAGKALPVTRPSGVTESYSLPLALTLSDPFHPAEVWIGLGGGGPLRRLSAHNDSFTRSVITSGPEEINFRSFDGTRVQGWLIKPANFRDDRRYPLIMSVHGGPHGMSGWGFNATFQAYAARGYAVLYLNPRGSSGYGQKFSDGTLNEWGGGDYKDLMAGVDEALRRYPWIDSARMGVTGGSYGGFMTNWIITQTPRFKAAVASASVSNLVSFYSTSLYQDLIHAEFGGFPWDNYEQLWQWSPMRYVRQAQTPTLFLHGELDNDVHITQAEEMYMALKRRGVESVLVRYPREGHGLREPRHRVDAIERTLAWFDRFLK